MACDAYFVYPDLPRIRGTAMTTPEGELWHYDCPNCGYDGPHFLFALNEAECGDCYAEFSVSAADYDRPCKPGCVYPEGHDGHCLDEEDVAEERLRSRDYESWANL